uniref:Uncharacterized protein n=1 Tax=Oryza meridionalis TaxID=40149 RepID=A0A0E0FBB5_9ORYZ
MAAVHRRLNSTIKGRVKRGKYGEIDDEEERSRFLHFDSEGKRPGREIVMPAVLEFGRER